MKILARHSIGTCLAAVLVIFAPAIAAAQSSADTGQDKTTTVVVEIDGSVPGFTQDQLATYITEQMSSADVTAWKFAAAPTAAKGTAEPANRVVWHFKLLPFAGGSVRYIGPALSKARAAFGMSRPVGIDVKIYLDGKYQASAFSQVSIQGGPDDLNLTGAVQKVTRTIVSDALTEDATHARKLAGQGMVKIG